MSNELARRDDAHLPSPVAEASYTPGPWRACLIGAKGKQPTYWLMAGSGAASRHLADLPDHPANARLIAAAPELLEALTELRGASAAMSRVIAANGLVGLLTAELTRCQIAKGFGTRAQAAVAKAEGR